MEIKKLTIPDKGVEHLSEWEGLFDALPRDKHYILNKKICGCGATEAFLRSPFPLILTSPRKHLLYNKLSQHLSDNYHLFRYEGDKRKYFEGSDDMKDLERHMKNLEEYLKDGGKKILVTYDSLGRIGEILGDLRNSWLVVVDEFQCQFHDAHYKPTTELQLQEDLKPFPSVCYLSATPFLERYLEMEDTYKDLPVYELLWDEGMIEKPEIELIKTDRSVLDLASDIIEDYRSGNGRTKMVDGEPFTSKEAVMYINNVSEIVKIIRKNELKPSEVTIICSGTPDNRKKVAKLGKGYEISEVPGKNDKLKPFTFCTSTVYVGSDFYSTNAYTYIFSNPQLGCMTLDVGIDLQQIIGRQRLKSNPFKNSGTLYYNTRASRETEEDLECSIREKNEKTQRKIENYQVAPHKSEELETLEKDIKTGGHRNHYCCIVRDSSSGQTKVVRNKFIEIAERRAWEISNRIYNNDFSIYRTLREGATIEKAYDSDDQELQELFREWSKDGCFGRKARLYCQLSPELLDRCSFIERKYHDYYRALGKDGMEGLDWREDRIKTALLGENIEILPKNEIHRRLCQVLQVGKSYSKSWLKELLQRIYRELGISHTLPSASDLEDFMTIREGSYREDGRKIAALKIESHLRKNVSLFRNIYAIKDPQTYGIDKVLELMKGDTYYQLKSKVDGIRNDLGRKNELKKSLPVLCCNGVFSERNRHRLQHYSSFTMLDFDHIEESRMTEFGEWLKTFPCTYATFISPSGQGWKAVVVHDNFEPLRHEDLYWQLMELYNTQEKDESGKDIARGTYLSYDTSLWINPSPVPFHYEPQEEKASSGYRTETVVRDVDGSDMIQEDSDPITDFLNKLSREIVSDESVIRMLRKVWTGESLQKGRNNTALSYAGVLCKAGVEKSLAREFIGELIPDFDITEILDYAYEKNIFGCERRRYNKYK